VITVPSSNSTSTGSGTKVSIVEEASEMGDQAYDPNPVKVKVGDTVTWTNDDSQAHTITSGPTPFRMEFRKNLVNCLSLC
jgi:plastocyanin